VPSVEEVLLLTALSRDKRLQVIGINYMQGRARQCRRFLGGYGNPYGFVGVDGNGRATIEWGVYGVPETFIVGREGKIVYKLVGPATAENIDTVLRAEIESRWYGPSRPSALFGGQILIWPHELKPVPNVNKRFCQAIDQAVIMMRRWCDPEPLQPSRHCRIVNRLNVDAMIRQ
jgi:hypothetical protein